MDSKGYQQELFEEFEEPTRRPRFLRKKKFPQKFFSLRLSQEKLVFLTIGLVVLLLVSFSLGVERGKRLSRIPQEAKSPHPKLAARIQEPGLSKDENLKESARNPQTKIGAEGQQQALATPEKETLPPKAIRSYAVQVATYKREELAQRELKRLELEGYNSFVGRRGRYFEVCVGPYSNKADAEASLKALRKRYQDCLLRRM